jgi:hypothetical protein
MRGAAPRWSGRREPRGGGLVEAGVSEAGRSGDGSWRRGRRWVRR